jgi:diacylglycerol kinase (ATP)
VSSHGEVGPAVIPRVQEVLRTAGLPYTVEQVDDPSEAQAVVRSAMERGDRFVVAVGADDLVHHVANGMLSRDAPADSGPVLGVIPAGTPSDFARTFGLPEDPGRAAGHLTGPGLYPIDAARVTWAEEGGSTTSRAFVNVAQAGLWAEVARRSQTLPAAFGRSRRFVAFWTTLASSRPTRVSLTGDRRSWEGQVHTVVVANCQYNGDGVKISPRSWPGDGYLDVLVLTGPRSDAFTILPRAFRGEHLPHPHIVEYRCRRLRIESERPLRIEADGQVLGTTPATFEVIPRAVLLKV